MNDQIIDYDKMTEKDMIDLLMELSETPHWKAVKRYHAIRCIMAENALCTIDPFKEPTQMARNQGIRMGLNDLEEFVKLEKEKRSKKEGGQKA